MKRALATVASMVFILVLLPAQGFRAAASVPAAPHVSGPVGDFDGDGYGDLAAGVPWEGVNIALLLAGAVNVIYGTPTGLQSADNQYWNQNSSGVDGLANIGDEFGYALASGDCWATNSGPRWCSGMATRRR